MSPPSRCFVSRKAVSKARKRGVALVIVLALVVMLSLLIVGLLLSAQSERQLTASQFHALDARLGAESALEIVRGQIHRGATQGVDSDGRGTFIWASQPGAIRVYDDDGKEHEILKLYSSSKMIAPGDDSLSEDLPDDWADLADEFVDLNEPVKRGGNWIFPIASPDALGTGTGSLGRVAGFASSLTKSGGLEDPDNRLVMPVRWLYVHEDGTVTSDPSTGNPYLRVAFWTDDESSKINLNTASASDTNSYWDVPRTAHPDDRNWFAWRQPVENEFNRYPGHPATVNLRTVFPAATVRALIEASPRYEWGGSENGSLQVNASTSLPNEKRDRLYATPDEFLYHPERGVQLAPGAETLSQSAAKLDTRRFFLTTASRSSDLNLFGQPRVTIWPISGIDSNQHRTIYDRTIAFNSTLGSGSSSKPYYFLRSNPNSQTDDWNLYDRNRDLFAYLRDLTSRDIPGFGGNFKEKYDGDVTGERDQILTQIFDYIRTVNLNETYGTRAGGLGGSSYISYTANAVAGNDGTNASFKDARGSGWVLPIKTPFGRGAGRVPVLSELGIWLIQTQNVTGQINGEPTYEDPSPPEVQPGLILETFSPMQGIMAWVPRNFSYRVRNIVAPQINGENIFPDDEVESTFLPPGGTYGASQDLGGTDGFAWLMSAGLSTALPNHLGVNPFLRSKAKAIKLQSGATTLTITEGEIEIDFMTSPTFGTKGQGTVFQTYRIKIPETTLPVPTPVQPTGSSGDQATVRNGWHQRKPAPKEPPTFLLPQDVVRGLPIRHGDYRTEAYLETVPAEFFEDAFASDYGFRTYKTKAYRGSKSGSYVSGLPYASENNSGEFDTPRPKIPSTINGLIEEGWDADFDNGLADLVDGPYLNKSDEGALSAGGNIPYYTVRRQLADGLFSPLRQVPSAVVFGSLPTGVKHAEAGKETFWRTLAFSPNPLSGAAHHGLSDPPDHLLLDLFTMPIVEPYAISEPFSTAGRLNLNRKLVPFTHFTRDTALHAALASQKIVAINNSNVTTYKATTTPPPVRTRHPVDAAETVKALDAYLAEKGQNLFRSASEICGVYLVPEVAPPAPAVTAADVAAWWNDYKVTGNNSRERPYATLYPLLTTRSNVFTMHVRAQSIKRLSSGKIGVRGEFRGSMLFERYLDPNHSIFNDATVDPDKVSLEPYFRFRTLNTKQFDL